MKLILTTVAGAALLSMAEAQTRVGNVTITRPGDVKNVTPPRTTPAPTPASATRSTGQSRSVSAPADLPAGWRYLTGRVVAPSDVRLPAGSKVQVSIVEVDRSGGQRATHLNIDFGTPALSAPYYVQYNPARMNSAENRYLLRAKVFDKGGNLLYMTRDLVPVPTNRAASVNIPVR